MCYVSRSLDAVPVELGCSLDLGVGLSRDADGSWGGWRHEVKKAHDQL
jgi:hypothetical protein